MPGTRRGNRQNLLSTGAMLSTSTRRRTAKPLTREQLAEAYPLSVVIPTRNSRHHLEKCLRALSLNHLKLVETLVVDDASSDDTRLAIQNWQGSPTPSFIHHNLRTGPAGARNTGMQKASHPYVLFLDSDVLLPSSSIEWIRESLDLYSHRPEVKGVLGLYGEETPHTDFLSNYKNLYTRYLYLSTEALSPYIHTPVFCIERRFLLESEGFNTDLLTAEDFQLGVKLGSQGYRFVIDRRISTTHLKHYSLRQALSENSQRIENLAGLKLDRGEKVFALRAHRWQRLLSLAIPGPALALGLLPEIQPAGLFLCLVLLTCLGFVNLSFLKLCKRSRGFWFALQAMAFLSFEMLVSEYFTLRSYLRQWLKIG